MGNFDTFERVPKSGENFKIQKYYTNEKTLYDKFMTECYNEHGVTSEYYIVTHDTSYDPIWGEDQNRRLVRKFDFQGFFELPSRDRTWSQFGIEVMDIFVVQVSKRHFEYASRLSGSTFSSANNFSDWGGHPVPLYDSYRPKIGDIIRNKYDGMFYEIIQIEDNQDEFLQISHQWDLTVKIFRDNHLDNSAIGSETSGVMNSNDIMKVNQDITNRSLANLFGLSTSGSTPFTSGAIYINNTETPPDPNNVGEI